VQIYPEGEKKMLRKMLLVLTVLSLAAMTLVKSRPAKASPDMQTITLNTGFDHGTQKKYPVAGNVAPLGPAFGPVDEYWTVIKDPINGTAPHAANNINAYPGAWKAAQGESQWISYSQTGSQQLKAGPYYYQKCFCLTKVLWDNKDAIAQSQLKVSVRADDAFYLGLNTMPDSSPTPSASTYQLKSGLSGTGGFSTPPAVWSISGDQLVKLLHPGRNCLNVRVDDIGGVITGFNLEGSLTTTGIDGIAKTSSPKSAAQFNSCSSCSKLKSDSAVEIQSGLVR
jgi:hypothetical protein